MVIHCATPLASRSTHSSYWKQYAQYLGNIPHATHLLAIFTFHLVIGLPGASRMHETAANPTGTIYFFLRSVSGAPKSVELTHDEASRTINGRLRAGLGLLSNSCAV